MPDYKKGQIYRLWSSHTDKFYIGSTCSPLAKRLYGHKADYKSYLNEKHNYITSFELFKLGIDDVKIELIEDFICQNKKELDKREGELIRLHKNNIVNHSIAGRTQKEWRDFNKDKMTEYNKIYRFENKDKISEYKKQYSKIYELENKDKISKRKKQYYASKKALLAAEKILVSTV